MMEMLTLGAPPSSIPGSIVSVVHKFSPQTKFAVVPKVNLVRTARTVLGIICEVLAAKKLAEAEKWYQFHSDGTT